MILDSSKLYVHDHYPNLAYALFRFKKYGIERAKVAATKLFYLSEIFRYRYCLWKGRVYLGPVMYAMQSGYPPIRHHYMYNVVRLQMAQRSSDEPFRILEIGSWAGGSALTWANAINDFDAGRGCVLCVDSWEPAFSQNDLKKNQYNYIRKKSLSGEIFRLFTHNIEFSKWKNLITYFRADSETAMSALGDQKFDLIYIDGSHYYHPVMRDILKSIPLLRDGGLLCGDDLDLSPSQVDENTLNSAFEEDFIHDPKTGAFYHPGVTKAIADTIGEHNIGVYAGFWFSKKTNGGFSAPSYAESDFGPLKILEHFPPKPFWTTWFD